MQWISVKDRLPEDNVNVLIKHESDTGPATAPLIWIAFFNSEFNKWSTYWLDLSKVTHWMPLPEAPKIEK